MRDAASWIAQGLALRSEAAMADSMGEREAALREALAAFEQAVACDAAHAEAATLRAETLTMLGDTAGALDALVTAPAGTLQRHRVAAEALLREGHWEAALEEARAGLAVERDGTCLWCAAEALTRLGRPVEAIAAWGVVLETPGLQVPRAKLLRTVALVQLEPTAAFTVWREHFIDAFEALKGPMAPVDLFELLRDDAVVREAWKAAVAFRPTTMNWAVAAAHWLRAGRPVESLEAAQHWLQLSPDDASAWVAQAEAHAAGGDRAQAIASYEHALALQPGLLSAKFRLQSLRDESA